MKKTITQFKRSFNHYNEGLGPLYKLTFTDETTALVYAETFFEQIKGWEPSQTLIGHEIDLEIAYTYQEPLF
jgi:hypothetical protein